MTDPMMKTDLDLRYEVMLRIFDYIADGNKGGRIQYALRWCELPMFAMAIGVIDDLSGAPVALWRVKSEFRYWAVEGVDIAWCQEWARLIGRDVPFGHELERMVNWPLDKAIIEAVTDPIELMVAYHLEHHRRQRAEVGVSIKRRYYRLPEIIQQRYAMAPQLAKRLWKVEMDSIAAQGLPFTAKDLDTAARTLAGSVE